METHIIKFHSTLAAAAVLTRGNTLTFYAPIEDRPYGTAVHLEAYKNETPLMIMDFCDTDSVDRLLRILNNLRTEMEFISSDTDLP